MEDIETLDLLGTPLMEGYNLVTMLLRFSFNMLVVWLMIHCLYYPKSRRRDYYFTFMLISISIFFLIFLLGGVKLKIGFALGLFAIFGIIRYRTESMPVREMTYLFCIIAISVINALAITISYVELVVTNVIFLLATWLFESYILLKHVSTKLIQYDRIALITPDKRLELIADLEHRTGLKIKSVEIGAIDFLRDMAIVKIHYETDHMGDNSINNELKLSREEWTDVERQ
ncbi:DUF4956 domain-containing protein [Bacteroides salyersiae]|jgi:hypothetical protein|uniref:DUF4956 domain-containing protein n=1 Tax=Bacteroides salyersiae TaxID=291644 RepID=UPI000326EC4F|nr:DUF4956 domain-containing protein [Bacteroides salyersiae]EOA49012.1 hypothetical protein HMPREF1532_02647 [Bacteroides salyersiae WAL 10018 = DSM 18765 = JCM 12988]MCS3061093.1 DUF4956 domain-containing protein [Bacteroides salyersiae]